MALGFSKLATLAKKNRRGGDTEIAHVTLGEIVLPDALQTPAVLDAIRQAALDANIPLEQLRVGSGLNSINPQTGQPEFNPFGSLAMDWISRHLNQGTTPNESKATWIGKQTP